MAQKKTIKKKQVPAKNTATTQLVNVKKRAQQATQKVRAYATSGADVIKATPAKYKAWKAADKKKNKYRSFRLSKRIKPTFKPIPGTAELLKQSLAFLWKNKKVFLLAISVYVCIYVLLLRSPIPNSVDQIQKTVKSALGEKSATSFKAETVTLGAVLSTSSNHTNSTVFIAALFLISMVYIWMIRQLHNEEPFKVRDAFYQAPIALIPTFLVASLAVTQIFPFALASFIYALARSGGIFVTGFEDLSAFSIVLGIGLLSFFWIVSSVMAVYIVTLPGMRPVAAVKAGNDIVKFRRFSVFRRMFGLLMTTVIFYLVALLVIIRVRSGLTFWFAEAFQIVLVPFVHIYLYKLYRSLL